MPVKIIDNSIPVRDFTIIAVCMAFYLNSKGISDENYHIVRILKGILAKIPKHARDNLTGMFQLTRHLEHTYQITEINNSNIADKFFN